MMRYDGRVKTTHPIRILTLAAALLLATGCNLPPPVAPESLAEVQQWVTTTKGPDVSLWTPSVSKTVHIDDKGILGPQIRLVWSKDGDHTVVRGAVGRTPVDMNLVGGALSGAAGRGIANLQFFRGEDQVVMFAGMFDGEPVTLRLTPDKIEGFVGRCGYTLARKGDAYVGSRTCARLAEQARVLISDQLADRPALNLGLALTAVLYPGA